jgi:Flp pilus assembly protein TadG
MTGGGRHPRTGNPNPHSVSNDSERLKRRRTAGCRGNAAPERGTMTMELVIMTPVLLAFIMLLVAMGRIVDAQSQIDGAARDAARAASIGRDETSAQGLADQAAQSSLSGTWCKGTPRTTLDFSQWRAGGQISVAVRCDIDLSGLSLIKVGPSKTMTGSFTVPLDTFRRVTQ